MASLHNITALAIKAELYRERERKRCYYSVVMVANSGESREVDEDLQSRGGGGGGVELG